MLIYVSFPPSSSMKALQQQFVLEEQWRKTSLLRIANEDDFMGFLSNANVCLLVDRNLLCTALFTIRELQFLLLTIYAFPHLINHNCFHST